MKTVRPGRREELLDAIAREEGRVARLESEQADVRSRLAALRAEVASFGAEPEIRVRLFFDRSFQFAMIGNDAALRALPKNNVATALTSNDETKTL